jgi:hypothetical protein
MHDLDRMLNESNGEYNEYGFEAGGGAFADEYLNESLAEEEAMTLASELLSVQSESELDHFLGKLIRKAGQAVGKFAKSSAGQALGGILKGAAKAALPAIGNAIAPGIGGVAAGMVGDAFGLESEGLSEEDAEWESAKRFVQFADLAAKKVAQAHPNMPPIESAKNAALSAAQKFAPGLLREALTPKGEPPHTASGNSGRWVRRGNQIILFGV